MMKLRMETFAAYGGAKCVCCGVTYTEFLCLDHINGGGAKERMSEPGGHYLYRRLRKQGWPLGYRVLCFNCNSSLGFYGYCPHQVNPASYVPGRNQGRRDS